MREYVYSVDMVKELMDMVLEYVGEVEHSCEVDPAASGVLSPEFTKARAERLRADFIRYFATGGE